MKLTAKMDFQKGEVEPSKKYMMDCKVEEEYHGNDFSERLLYTEYAIIK
jgi:hypothetical protein